MMGIRLAPRAAGLVALGTLVWGVALCFFPQPARGAQQPTPSPAPSMTLKQAVDFALSHNPTNIAAQAQAIAAAAALTRTRSAQLPQVAANTQSLLQRQSASNAGTFAQFGLQPTANFSQNTSQVLGTANVINLASTLEARQAKRSRSPPMLPPWNSGRRPAPLPAAR